MSEDRIFWERLAEMPFAEHEQECVLRREHLGLRKAVLQNAKVEAEARGDKEEAKRLGAAMFEDCAQMTALNERIKYVRRLDDKISWRTAVRTVLGEAAYEQCVAWRIQEECLSMPFAVPA